MINSDVQLIMVKNDNIFLTYLIICLFLCRKLLQNCISPI